MRVTPPTEHRRAPTAGVTTPREDRPDPGTGSAGHRWTVGLLMVACLVVGMAAVLGQGLLPGRGGQVDEARPLSPEEAARLAAMRQRNWQDARAGVRATIGDGADQVHLTGWVDWRHPMVYLARSGPTPGTIAELIQAVPGVVATRPGDGTPARDTPDRDAPRDSPGRDTPGDARSDRDTPGDTRPGRDTPGDTRPDRDTPGDASPGRDTPGDARPDRDGPRDGASRDARPDRDTPGDAGADGSAPAPAGGAAGTSRPEIIDPYPPPPVDPPAKGWRVRQPGADGPPGAPTAPGTVDALAVLLLTISAEQADAPDLLARSEARWLRHDRAAGHEVDVLLGPAVPPGPAPAGPPAPGRAPVTSLAAMGGAVQYWLDRDARVHRLEALLATDTPVRVDLDRADRTAPAVLDVLGGATLHPRPVTDAEAETLARLRQRNLAAGGGEVRLTLPAEDGGMTRAAGWLDWRRTVAYLAVAEPAGHRLVRADGSGVATRSQRPARTGPPPLPAPQDGGWKHTPWEGRGDERGGYDLDLLLNEALSLSGWERDDVGVLRETAVWLRADELRGTPVAVYEIPRPIEVEAGVAAGEARLRYWVDTDTGVLRRLEIRTRSGGFGQLDLRPGPVPIV